MRAVIHQADGAHALYQNQSAGREDGLLTDQGARLPYLAHRPIKEECVSLTEFADFADAQAQVGRFLDQVYQHKRIHSALGYLTPAEFESQWRAEQAPQEAGHPT